MNRHFVDAQTPKEFFQSAFIFPERRFVGSEMKREFHRMGNGRKMFATKDL